MSRILEKIYVLFRMNILIFVLLLVIICMVAYLAGKIHPDFGGGASGARVIETLRFR